VLIVSVIVQSNCRILQFLHQIFNVFDLMLDDALLKCVFTEVGLFSIVAFKTLDISQGSVATQLRCGGIFIAKKVIMSRKRLMVRIKTKIAWQSPSCSPRGIAVTPSSV